MNFKQFIRIIFILIFAFSINYISFKMVYPLSSFVDFKNYIVRTITGSDSTNDKEYKQYEQKDIVEYLKAKVPSKKTYQKRDVSTINMLVIHHAAGLSTIQRIAEYHVYEKKWSGIGYHYVINQDGVIFNTNTINTISAHCGDTYNATSIGICMLGNLDINKPNEDQIGAIKYIVSVLLKQHPNIKYIIGHSDVNKGTICPGKYFDVSLLQKEFNKGGLN